jgi:hypothetical protein
MSQEQQLVPRKPAYRELWCDVGGTQLDIWQGET